MIAVDTNILVYAHRSDSDWHEKALDVVRRLAESDLSWVIPSHSLIEFYSIVTHPRIYNPPSTPLQAKSQIQAWLASPSLILAHSTKESVLETFIQCVDLKIKGPQVHDVRLANDCAYYGVTQLYSADRDFTKITFMKITNPLVIP
jgi:toxin-antitoxin system PIN domain toxin